MGTGSRKLWLETQTDDVQFDVLSMDARGMRIDDICATLKERCGLDVPRSTLHRSLVGFKESLLGSKVISLYERVAKQNPSLDPAKLARKALLELLATKQFKAEDLDAAALVAAGQQEAWIDLRRRELEAKEEGNRIRREQAEIARRRVELLERKLGPIEKVVGEARAAEQAGKTFDHAAAFKQISAVIGVGGELEERVEPGN